MSHNFNLLFYNVFIAKNGKLTNIRFNSLIDHINRSSQRQRDSICLKGVKFPSELQNASDRAFSIGSYRARAPKIGDSNTTQCNDITGEVFEQTNIFYQHTERLFLFEYNHYGAKIADFKKYFETFLNTSNNPDDPKWTVEFKEVTPRYSISSVLAARDITNFSIKLNLNSQQIDVFRQHQTQSYLQQLNGQPRLESEVREYVEKTLLEMVTTRNLFGGATRFISFSKGRSRTDFNIPALKTLLAIIDTESGIFESIKVDYVDQQGVKHTNVDLKNERVLSESVTSPGDAWETVLDSIEDHFYNGRTGQGNYRNYTIQEILNEAEYPYPVLQNI